MQACVARFVDCRRQVSCDDPCSLLDAFSLIGCLLVVMLHTGGASSGCHNNNSYCIKIIIMYCLLCHFSIEHPSLVRSLPPSFVELLPLSFVELVPSSLVRSLPPLFVELVPPSLVRSLLQLLVRLLPPSWVRLVCALVRLVWSWVRSLPPSLEFKFSIALRPRRP